MRKRSMGLLVLLTCFLLVMTGCSEDKAEDMIKDTIGALMDAENEAIEKDTQESQMDYDDDSQDNEALLEEELNLSTDEVSHAVSAKMPEGYPYDFCPLYEPSEIEIAIRSEDDVFIGYTVGLLTKDSVDQVKNFYMGYSPQNTNDMGMMAVYVFEAENGVDYATVSVMENPDEGEKEFETSFTISVGLGK
ncbi:hypothetical protein [Petrocella sp. FN5]|uniref:hypothetical protein n=1 Tax=Petrocella sp. FN5 TaxID=3032002 RepID=UPI0023DCCF5D|nr:hypothetical protein [Petrocella sp. FN5]MDF1618520.1 hypothetical protein [Petrocella sp. FN5]